MVSGLACCLKREEELEYRLNKERMVQHCPVTGVSGSGKSVLAANTIRQLRQQHKQQVPVLFFFFRGVAGAKHTPETAIRSSMAQLLPYSPALQASMMEHRTSRQTLTVSKFWAELRAGLRRVPKAYVVVDAPDEMDVGSEQGDGSEDGKILEFLADLTGLTQQCQPADVKLIVTSKPITRIGFTLGSVAGHDAVVNIELEAVLAAEDMARLVKHRLVDTPVAISEEDKAIVVEGIPMHAKGVLLHAKLVLGAVLADKTDNRQVLDDFSCSSYDWSHSARAH